MKTRILFLLLLLVLSVNLSFSQGFNTIVSPDGNNVFAAGNQGKIFRSVNGGQAYSSYVINNTVNYNYGFARDSLVWFAGSDGKIYKTAKNAINLIPYNTGVTSSINSVFFLNASKGFVCGDSGVVLKTSNGGLNWTSINSGIVHLRYNSVSFLDSLNGVLAGDSGKLYLTTNAGLNWALQPSLTSYNLLKAKYLPDGIAVVGEYGVLLIKQGVGSWGSVSTRVQTDIRSLSGNSINNIHVVGGGGFIRNNKNNSSKFLNFEINPMVGDLKDIIYVDSLTGFAVSSLNQAIIKTTNGGVNWLFTAGTTANYSWLLKLSASGGIGNNLCRHPYDRNSVFCMWGSTVYVSRNRGETWSQIATTSLGSSAHSFYVSPLDTNIWLCAILRTEK